MNAVAGLDADRLDEMLRGTVFEGRVEVRSSVGSTNDELRGLARAGAPAWTVVVADEQRAGRGRHGRRWYSAPGRGLYLSVLLRPREPVEGAARWTLAVAVAAAEACREVSGAGIAIKWPNDLMYGGRKLGGVLAELRCGTPFGAELVIGTGLNVAHGPEEFPADLSDVATSLRIASGRSMLGREPLVCAYLERLERVVRQASCDDWDELLARWLALSPSSCGGMVRVRGRRDGENYDGRTEGIDSTGALLVRRADGTLASVSLPDSVTLLGE